MKRILFLAGLLAILATSGCVIREEHHPRGGAYDHYYYDHGRGHYHAYDRDPSMEFRYRSY